MDKKRGEGDKDDGTGADKAKSLSRGIKNGGELIHQSDDGYCQPGKPDLATLEIGDEGFLPKEKEKEDNETEVNE
jgi:hypothetical protein